MGDEPDYAIGGFDVRHAACLAYNLPPDSRVMKKLNPEFWDERLSLLSLCEFWAHTIAWMLSDDARHNRNRPKLHSPAKEERETMAVSRERLAEIMNRRRTCLTP